jgi:hypothetical protein
MEIKWIIIAVFSVCIIAFVIYLILRNRKDEKEVITFFNETEIDEEPEPKEMQEKD